MLCPRDRQNGIHLSARWADCSGNKASAPSHLMCVRFSPHGILCPAPGTNGAKSPELLLKDSTGDNPNMYSPGCTGLFFPPSRVPTNDLPDSFLLLVPNGEGLAPLASASLYLMKPQTFEPQPAYNDWFVGTQNGHFPLSYPHTPRVK